MTGATGRDHPVVNALVYGDVNLNHTDGSAIWAQSTVEVLARAGAAVTFLLKAPVRTDRLVEPLRALPGVRVVPPFEDRLLGRSRREPLNPREAVRAMRDLDRQVRFDVVVLRGLRLVSAVVEDGAFDGRIWAYLTDIPQSAATFGPDDEAELGRIAGAARYLLCQTEELRGFLEAMVPAVAGKALLFPPVVPLLEARRGRREGPAGHVRLVYSGKFAPRWNVIEMTGLPRLLAERGILARLDVIGDKVHEDPDDPSFAVRVRESLSSTPNVLWRGGHPRAEAMAMAAEADIGLSWRAPALDASLELSTKVLEFGSVGLPVVLNRTPMHELLLGADYPLFAATEADVVDVVEAAVRDHAVYALASDRCAAAAADFTLAAAVERTAGYLERAFPSAPALLRGGRKLRVGVASHDLKFFTRILDHLRSLPELEVRVDEWPTLHEQDERSSRSLVEWADVVICEWCGPNALWYANHKRAGQRLIVRLHRFELYGPWPAQLRIDAVDQVVCVSPHYARLTREATGWPVDKIGVAPNWVDDRQLDRPKLPGARFHLGFIGVAPMRKRLDLAVDVLERLRTRDPRFMLFAKTKMPWDYPWIWKKAEEREHIDEVLRRIQTRPALRDGVVFDSFGPDVAQWLRRVGFMLSTSDDESFHLAPAEAMASGAVPAILPWPGADTIYDPRWIQPSTDAMADAIQELVDDGGWDEARLVAQAQARAFYGLDLVLDLWTGLLLENLPASSGEGTLAVAGSVAGPSPAPGALAAPEPIA